VVVAERGDPGSAQFRGNGNHEIGSTARGAVDRPGTATPRGTGSGNLGEQFFPIRGGRPFRAYHALNPNENSCVGVRSSDQKCAGMPTRILSPVRYLLRLAVSYGPPTCRQPAPDKSTRATRAAPDPRRVPSTARLQGRGPPEGRLMRSRSRSGAMRYTLARRILEGQPCDDKREGRWIAYPSGVFVALPWGVLPGKILGRGPAMPTARWQRS